MFAVNDQINLKGFNKKDLYPGIIIRKYNESRYVVKVKISGEALEVNCLKKDLLKR